MTNALIRRSIPLWLDWMKYLSLWYYGFEALSINQWRDVEYINCEIPGIECLENGQDVLKNLNFDETRLLFDVVMLGVLAIGFRFIGFMGLLYRGKRNY